MSVFQLGPYGETEDCVWVSLYEREGKSQSNRGIKTLFWGDHHSLSIYIITLKQMNK